MKISAGLCICVCICMCVPGAGREAPRRRQQKNDRWEGEVEAAGPRRWRGGGRGAPSALASPGRAAGARGSGRRRRRGVGWVKSQEGRGGRGGADSGPSGEADAPRAVRRRRRRDAATTTTSDGKVRRGGLRLSVSRSLSPSLAGPRRPSSPRAAPPKPWSAPSLNCFERLSSDLICEDADYVRRALPPLAHITPLPRHGDARAFTRTCSLRTDAKADVLARATGTRAKKEQSVGPTD